jgi:hypothetical protein
VRIFSALGPPACEPFHHESSTRTLNPCSLFTNFTDSIPSDSDYAKITGTYFSKTPVAASIEQSNSPEAIFQLLHYSTAERKPSRNIVIAIEN